ncbi:uncharacterized protein STEHIDRAFT_162400 [Stereum hirsutum FP-91666 SS1]|uniref:uncharacterized protein n=1 Tax=Stereum hirsutum (strain FP-91666) TaxID=721885 RepID=UPI0004449616|nr:uncharacterized protein STEHIDRAFT_162400 [Stereum hirsutum FP-91666 SS1]EIM80618.1 hypothetical protein STEHIDRAFT_162400 [Stereum hirsutum FP-91666 SS1]
MFPTSTGIHVVSAFFALSCVIASPFVVPRADNDGIHLAVSPNCGPLGGNTADVNAGIDLSKIKAIVSFGDSYTDGGKHDGSPLDPPVLIPPSAFAGGRSTDGPVWIEYIADDIGAKFMDYAASTLHRAVVNISLWPDNPLPRDFLQQMSIFLGQNNNLDSHSTLYTIFFGINDWLDSFIDGDHLPEAAQDLLDQIAILSNPPTNGRNFLITDDYGRGNSSATGDAWKQQIFDGISAFHSNNSVGGANVSAPLNVAFGDFATIWDGVLGPDPGYEAFGYTSTGYCVFDGSTTDDLCPDPKHTFYWFDGHPSNETHRIMADYVEEVLSNCVVS